MTDKIQRRFEQLNETACEIEATKHSETTQVPSRRQAFQRLGNPRAMDSRTYANLDDSKFNQWSASVCHLLYQVFGESSPIYQQFNARIREDSVGYFNHRRAIFNAAKDDYENGFANIRSLISADVFADELEQAEELLTAGYKLPAAVVAGTVLETTLRNMCDIYGIELEKRATLNKLNDDLAKQAAYNKAKADQIRAWSKIRNEAAHGHPDEFTDTEVKLMIDGVRDFVANQLS